MVVVVVVVGVVMVVVRDLFTGFYFIAIAVFFLMEQKIIKIIIITNDTNYNYNNNLKVMKFIPTKIIRTI